MKALELIDLIKAADPGWIPKAKVRTDEYAAAGEYTGGTDFWGDIKQVYIELQHEKCAYCETKLQGAALASKVHEVEHFRPKSSVKPWPDRRRRYWKYFPTAIKTGDGSDKGYYLLAYHPFNYAIACTRCNSTLKSNHFPVRGKRNVKLEDPSRSRDESALLVYPLSDLDVDPREIISFDGVLAVPRHASGPDNERAVATISFFQLNHEDLTTRRAEMLVYLWPVLEYISQCKDPADCELAKESILAACGAGGQFSACMAAFCELYQEDKSRAKEKWIHARKMKLPVAD